MHNILSLQNQQYLISFHHFSWKLKKKKQKQKNKQTGYHCQRKHLTRDSAESTQKIENMDDLMNVNNNSACLCVAM